MIRNHNKHGDILLIIFYTMLHMYLIVSRREGLEYFI